VGLVAVMAVAALPWLVRRAGPPDPPSLGDAILLAAIVGPVLARVADRARVVVAGLAMAVGGLGWSLQVVALLRAPILTADHLAAMDWLRAHTTSLEGVCGDASPSARFLPAVAGRPLASDGNCRLGYESPGQEADGSVVFRNAGAAIRLRSGSPHRFTAPAGTPAAP
jgi:hypothetical protein